jgi:hypothetical protein
MARNRGGRLQSSFELLITLSFGLAVLMPLVVIAFLQLSNANVSLSSIEAQQAASKLASAATLVGSEGALAKQVVQISIPPNVRYIYVGNLNNAVGHEIIFGVSSPSGLSYVTAYTPATVSGSLGGISSAGTYFVNVTSMSACPSSLPGNVVPCVYMSPKV